MKIRILILLLAVFGRCMASDANEWITDLDKGKKLASDHGRQLLIFFTGSKWCGGCKLIHERVISTPEFKTWAKDKVLVMLDYPPLNQRNKPEFAQLMQIKEDWHVIGFPTLILAGPNANELRRTVGFNPEGDPKRRYISELTAN